MEVKLRRKCGESDDSNTKDMTCEVRLSAKKCIE